MNLNSKTYIVIVEDSPVQAKKLKFFLEENGYEVSLCMNGIEALNSIKNRQPTLIISDIVMPDMDGYTFCQTLKTEPNLRHIPVILLTSLRDPLDIIRGLQSLADNFITKPYDDYYLLTRIQYLLANRELRKQGSAEMVMEVIFRGEKFQINSERKQILDLLLSVYEAAIYQNEELIKTQELLKKANNDLLRANDELEAFTRTVTHDLRSPLALIKQFLGLIKDDHFNNINTVAQKYINTIDGVTDNMFLLVDDLLRLSKAGLTQLEYKTVNLAEIAQTILETLKISNPERKVEVIIENDLICNGDIGLMEVVMQNLIDNAWKYSSKKPDARIHIGKRNNNGITEFFVSDNGAGFNMEKVYKLFSPFGRLHDKRDFPGTGIGLVTTKRIVERHGGNIRPEAAEGQGATFYFWLP